MNKLTLISSLLGGALVFACGDSGSGMTNPTNATKTSDATDSDSTGGSTSTSTSTTHPTTSAGGSEGGGTTGGTGGCQGFLCLPDGGGVDGDCDPYAEPKACPDKQKCVPYANDGGNSWNAAHCVDVDPNPGSVGDECTSQGIASGIDSCDVGAMCWNVSMDTGKGTCVAYCKGSPQTPTCDEADKLCVIANDGILNLCLPKCDPLLPDSCPGELCLPNPQGEAGFACILDASMGMGTVDASCAFANACNPGLICVNVALSMKCDQGATGCCEPYCDLTMGNQMDMKPNAACDSMGGQFCLPLFDMGMAPPGAENVGVCGIPQ